MMYHLILDRREWRKIYWTATRDEILAHAADPPYPIEIMALALLLLLLYQASVRSQNARGVPGTEHMY